MRLRVALVLLATAAGTARACDEPVGEIVSLELAGEAVEQTPVADAALERAGDIVAARAGEPICPDDVITVSPAAQVIVRMGEVEGDEAVITLEAGSRLTILDEHGADQTTGGLFADLRGRFDLVTRFGLLAAQGTAYDVVITDDGLRVTQVEGQTRLTDQANAGQTFSESSVYELRAGASTEIVPLDSQACRELVAANSRALLRSLPPVPTTLSLLDEAAAPPLDGFVEARSGYLCMRRLEAQRELGRALTALRRPRDALEALEAAARDLSGAALARNRVAAGHGYLLMGQVDAALGAFERAQRIGGASVSATAGLGDAYRDRGLNLTGSKPDQALHAFSTSERYYVKAIREAQPAARGAVLIALGDLMLLRSGVQPERSEALFSRASTHFGNATSLGYQPHARLGLARIPWQRAQLIPTQTVVGGDYNFGERLLINAAMALLARQQRRPHREEAAELLRQLVDDFPGFSPAAAQLGRVEAALGNRDEAQRYLRRALSVDPRNTSAYDAYAEVVRGDERRRFRNAYARAEFEAVRSLHQRRTELTTSTPTVEVSAAPLTASASAVQFTPDVRRKVITFTNHGEQATEVDSVDITGDQGAFRIDADSCRGRQVDKGDRCRVTVRFTGRDAGSYAARLEMEGGGGLWDRDVRLGAEISPPPQYNVQ